MYNGWTPKPLTVFDKLNGCRRLLQRAYTDRLGNWLALVAASMSDGDPETALVIMQEFVEREELTVPLVALAVFA